MWSPGCLEEVHHGSNELGWHLVGEAVEVKDEAEYAVRWRDRQLEELVP